MSANESAKFRATCLAQGCRASSVGVSFSPAAQHRDPARWQQRLPVVIGSKNNDELQESEGSEDEDRTGEQILECTLLEWS